MLIFFLFAFCYHCLSIIFNFSTHLCVGFLFLVVHFRLPATAGPPAAHTQLAHTQLTQNTTCPHTTSSTHNLLTTPLNHHTTSSHPTCPPHHLCPPGAHTQLAHTQLTPHTQLVPARRPHTTCLTHNLLTTQLVPTQLVHTWHLWHWAGSGGALGSRLAPWSPPPFAWQAWHLATSTVTLRGRRRTPCMDRHFAWQAWHLWHWAGSGGALGSRYTSWSHTAVCVAGMVLGDMDLYFAWHRVALRDMDRHFASQAWHLWHWAGSMGLVWRRGCRRRLSTVTLRGRRGTSRHGSSLCVAGMALMALGWSTNNLSPHNLSTHNLLTHNLSPHNLPTHNLLTTPLVTTQLPHVQLVTTQLGSHTTYVTHTTCKHTTYSQTTCPHITRPHTTCVTHNLYLATWTCYFASQAWHFATWIVTLRGRRGTYSTGLAPVARLGLVWHRGRRRRLRGRRGTSRDRLSLCGASCGFSRHGRAFCVEGVVEVEMRLLAKFACVSIFLHVPSLPRIFVWGSCLWLCTSACPLRPALPPPTQLAHTHTHNLLTTPLVHTTSSHTTCHHTTCSHTQLPHTQLVTTQLAHTQLTHTHTTCPNTTYSHTTCSHTTCHHTTCHHTTCSHTTYSHTQLANTQLTHKQLVHT